MVDTILRRRTPPFSYRSSGRVTYAPSSAIAATAEVLSGFGAVEATCVWLGKFNQVGNATVETVVVPKQINRPFNYQVPPDGMLEVASVARPHQWTIVVAVHSHPGSNVEHSAYDDRMTPSRRALSMVLPNYGHWSGIWSQAVGIHEFIDSYWHLLPEHDALTRIVFTDGPPIHLVDLR
jgi:hypothetical protein